MTSKNVLIFCDLGEFAIGGMGGRKWDEIKPRWK